MLFEYRFEQTPTLLLVLPRQREQTNHVIRRRLTFKNNFARIVFVSEKQEKDHYINDIMTQLLDLQVKDRLKRGIFIGD